MQIIKHQSDLDLTVIHKTEKRSVSGKKEGFLHQHSEIFGVAIQLAGEKFLLR